MDGNKRGKEDDEEEKERGEITGEEATDREQNWIRRVERRWSSKREADRSCVWSLIRKMVVRG